MNPSTVKKYAYDEPASPLRRAEIDRLRGVSLLHYRDSSPVVDQAALTGNILAIHLGGSKRVRRTAGRRSVVHDVELGSLTIAPAHHAYRWDTEGPIEFAHLVLGADILQQVALEEFECSRPDLALSEVMGFRSPLIEQTLCGLLADLERPAPGRIYRDGLLTVLTYMLLRDHSSLKSCAGVGLTRFARGGLSGRILSRVVEYVEANLAEDIALRDLTALTGLSRAQFFRAFKQSTGLTPGAYISILRKTRARTLEYRSGYTREQAFAIVGLKRLR